MTEHYAAAIGEIGGVRVLSLTALPPPGTSPAFRSAWRTRQKANASGRCACGAQLALPNRRQRRAAQATGRVLHASMLHEADCPASDESLARLYHASMS